MMDSILSMIIKIEGDHAYFLITPEEFDAAIEESNNFTQYEKGELSGDSCKAFKTRLRAYILEKKGIAVKDADYYQDKLLEAELLNAPDYIRECPIDPQFKHTLWKVECDSFTDKDLFDQAKREIAKTGYIYHTDWADLKEAINWQIRSNIQKFEYERDMKSKTVTEYAELIVNKIGIYGEDEQARKQLIENLSRLTKTELYAIIENIKYTDEMIAYTVAIKALKESIK
jgi:hypothetical protein